MSHLHALRRIFRYFKGQPKLGLWYPRDSPYYLEAFSDSDYTRASLDRKSTTRAEYVAAANCCGQVLWIQNQMLDYEFNFMNTKIYIDNKSTICIMKNPVFHSKTKHIEIRHHFIRDSYEKRLIQVIKIHTDHNVTDLLTKAFDVFRFNFLVASIGMLNSLEHGLRGGLELKDKKELPIPGQTATGKEFSSLLMASSLPKTISAKFRNTATSKTVNLVKQIHAVVDGKAVVILESSVRNDLLFDDEDGITCITNDDIFENLALMGQSKGFSGKVTPLFDSMLVQNHAPEGEGGDSVERAITTDASLVAAQDSDNIIKTQTTAMPNIDIPQGIDTDHTFGSGEGSMEHTFELMDTVPPTPYDSPLTGGYIPGSDEGRLKLKELMAMCIKLSKQVIDLEKEKDAQAVEILKLKQRVKKLKRKRKSSISHLKRRIYRQVESSDDDLDEEDASKQGRTSDKTKPMFKDNDFDDLVDEGMAFVQEKDAAGERVSIAAPRTPPTTTTIFDDEDVTMAMAQTLIKMKEEKAKAKGVAIKDVEDSSRPIRSITTLQPLPTINPKDKDRAQKEKQKQEEATNAALAEEFDEIQARMDADHELAVRLTHEEQEKYTIEERATLLAEYFERRKKQLAAERAEAIRNKPPTRAQVRNRMITYLKHMGKYTHQQLKHKTLEELQKLYQKEQKWINDFQPMDIEEDGSNTKKAGKRIKRIADSTSKQKSPKKSKVIKEQESAESNAEAAADYEQEKEELRMWLAVVPDEDETVDPELLSVKYPIVDWESQNLGSVDMEDIHVYKIIRADGNTSYHKTFSSMLRKFNRQDLMDLHRLVMKRFEDNTPKGYNLLLWGDLKVMFEPNAEDEIWLEKRYPLIKEMLKKMLNWKLEAEVESTMAFELLKFIKRGLLGIMDFYNLVLLIQLDTAGDG
ncbi:hypothetical protein Tco_0264937 [Tanacetum coccineum]